MAIDKAIIDIVMPHLLSAKSPAAATMPTIAAGQARNIATQRFAHCNGGPELTTKAIKGIAEILASKPNQVKIQY